MALVLALCAGCGGAPFTTDIGLADPPEASPEASPVEASSAEASPGDAEVEAEGGGHPEASSEAGVSEGGVAEGGIEASPESSSCTPLGQMTYYCAAGENDGYYAPTDYCVIRGGQSSIVAVPAECQCAETYNCACVEAAYANGGCGAGTPMVSCAVGGPAVGPNGLVVTCQ